MITLDKAKESDKKDFPEALKSVLDIYDNGFVYCIGFWSWAKLMY